MTGEGTQVGKGAVREVNVVADDAIWRTLIRFELASAKNWERSWGFMRETLRPEGPPTIKLPPIAFPSNLTSSHSSGLPSKLPCGLASPTEPILSDFLNAHKVTNLIIAKTPSEKYMFPPSTSTEYGWKWKTGGGINPLEVYGSNAKGRGNIEHWLMT